ncbi:MAG: hypothetical protein IT514_10640, partial [Burkholderiales bacterium]|nr:hypothetical protein [Burkholderiales bacterium]
MSDRFQSRALALLLAGALLCASSAQAQHRDLAPLPDQLVTKLRAVGKTQAPPQYLRALRGQLNSLETIAAGTQSDAQRMLLAGQRNELSVVQGQFRASLAQTRSRFLGLGLAGQATALDKFQAAIDERFARLNAALRDADVDGISARRAGVQKLRSEVRALRGPALNTPRLGGQGVTPTRHPTGPAPYRPVRPSKSVPMYVMHDNLDPTLLASLEDDIVAAAPPVPSEASHCYPGSQDWLQARRADLGLDANGNPIQSGDAGLAPEIVALAEQLEYSPVKIFEYVYNNIRFEPYYGSLKGALATLYAQAGGPTDQASLLIALLRASNIPARYVRGQVEMMDSPGAPDFATGGRVAQWLGVKSYLAAAAVLSTGHFNSLLLRSGTTDYGLWFNHVWVEACVAYAHYRGAAVDNSGFRWIALDPSYKDHTYQPGIALTPPVDVQAVLSAHLQKRHNGPLGLPHEAYAGAVESAVRSANPGASVSDVPYKGTIAPIKLDILPNSLPYEVVSFTDWPGTASPVTAVLPGDHRYRWFIHGLAGLLPVPRAGSEPPSGFSLYLPDAALKRVTLSFAPATDNDQATIAAWNSWQGSGEAGSWPCVLQVNLVPVIRLEGAVQSAPLGSGSLPACSQTGPNGDLSSYDLKMSVGLQELNPQGLLRSQDEMTESGFLRRDPFEIGEVNDVGYGNIAATNWHALQAYALQASDRLLALRAAKLLQAVNSTPDPSASAAAMDETVGEYLHLIGLKYLRYVSDAASFVGGLTGSTGFSGNHLGLVSTQMKAQYLFELPFAVNSSDLYVDFPGILVTVFRLTSDALAQDAFLLAGYSGSAYEHYVLQENARADAVSTVRALQRAAELGIEVLTISDAQDWGDCASSASKCWKFTNNANPNLNLHPADVAVLETSYVKSGFKLTIPRSLVPYSTASPGWTGLAFVAERLSSSGMAASFAINKYAGAWMMGVNGVSPASFDPVLISGFQSSGPVPEHLSAESGASPEGTEAQTIHNAGGQDGLPSTAAGDPVNMVSGNMYHVERDIWIKGRGGLPIVFERSYNSRDPRDRPLGYGWTHSFNHFLRFHGVEDGVAKVSWIDGSGRETFFAAPQHDAGDVALGAEFANPPGVFVRFFRQSTGTFVIREKSGLEYRFASVVGPAGTPGPQTAVVLSRLETIKDRNGNELSLSYSATGCSNRLCTVTDSLGRALTFRYAGNYISEIEDFRGRKFQYQYDANNLIAFKNPLAVSGSQNPVAYEYYSANDGTSLAHKMKQYTLPRGNGMRFEYYANGRAFRHTVVLTDGSLSPDQVNTFTYNDFRRETVQTNERGFERRFFFDPFGNPIRIVEENGATHTYTYDCADVTQAAGSTSCARPYDRRSKTDPNGLTTAYEYDGRGNVAVLTTPRGATVQYLDYTEFNQPRRIKDANGNWTILRYDSRGNLTDSMTVEGYVPGPCGATPPECVLPPSADNVVAWTVNAYDDVGNLTRSKRVRDFAAQLADNTALSNTGPIVAFAFDPVKLNAVSTSRIGIQNADASATTVNSAVLEHDGLGRLINGVDRDWYPVQITPDALDRVELATDSLGNLRRYHYDENGNLLGQSLQVSANGTTSVADSSWARYDDADRRAATTDAGGFVTGYEYDAAGNRVRVTSPDNYAVTSVFDEANRVVATYDAQYHVVRLDRGVDGRIRSVTDANGKVTSYEYWGGQQDGRLRSVTYPRIGNNNGAIVNNGRANASPQFSGAQKIEYEYDANGNTTRITVIPAPSALGLANRVTSSAYDALNRPQRVVGPQYEDLFNGPVCPVTRLEYDALGSLHRVSAGHVPSSAQQPCAAGVEQLTVQAVFDHDDFGRVIRRTDGIGRFWSFTYTANNELRTGTDPRGHTSTYNWYRGGLMASRIEQGGRTTSYQRNALGQALQIEHPEVGYTYAYDAAHRLESVTDSRAAKSLAYRWSPGGLLDRIMDSDGAVTQYLYDPAGRLSGISAPNGDTAQFRFDPAGRLEQRLVRYGTNGAGGLRTQYAYNEDNSINRVSNEYALSGTFTGLISQHFYSYDGLGNRISEEEFLPNGSGRSKSYG